MADVSDSPVMELPVDAEHGGKRAAGCGALLLGFLLPFLLVMATVESGWLLAFIAGLTGAAALAYLVERLLRDRWPSGRVLRIETERVSLRRAGEVEETLNATQHINALAYHFIVRRNSRVRKGWHVIALVLEQDDAYLPVYTFASPETFEALPQRSLFRLLERPTDESLKSAGTARRLYTAETYRSQQGAELRFDEFAALLTALQERFPHWMPKS